MKRIHGLYLLADTSVCQGSALYKATRLAAAGGVRVVQYRDKSGDARQRRVDAQFLADICHDHDMCFLINDDAPLAAEVNADGVHIGREDGGVAAARAALGNDKIIGVSCYNQIDLGLKAQADGANYVAFGSFYSSTIKPQAVRADLALLKSAAQYIFLPIVAIGGITKENAAPLIENGADAVAVISSVLGAENPGAAARELTHLFKRQKHD